MRTRAALAGAAVLMTALAPLAGPADILATDVAGIPAENVGTHGPKTNHLVNLELVGHSPIPIETVDGDDNPITLPIGNNGAPALLGDCAYVGRWHDYTGAHGIQVIDISDPAAPVRVGAIVNTTEADMGLPAAAVSREIRAVPGERLLVVLLFSQSTGAGATGGLNTLNVYRVGETCTDVTLAGRYEMRTFRGHEFFLWADPVHDGRVLAFITAPIAPPNVQVVDLSDPENPSLLTVYDAGIPVASPRETAAPVLGNYAHSISISPDGSEGYLSYWDGGFFTIDTSALADPSQPPIMRPSGLNSLPYIPGPDEFANTHSAVMIPGTNDAVVGAEIYITTDGCPYGWMTIVRAGDATTPPAKIGEFKLEENKAEKCGPRSSVLPTGRSTVSSKNDLGLPIDGTFTMHNQTVLPEYVFTSWYGGGLRVIDVSDPTAPAEAGAFVPVPLEATATDPNTPAPYFGGWTGGNPDDDWWVGTWSYPIIRDGLIYVTDVRSGLYILQPAAGAPFADEVAATAFAEGNSNIGTF